MTMYISCISRFIYTVNKDIQLLSLVLSLAAAFVAIKAVFFKPGHEHKKLDLNLKKHKVTT